LPSFVGQSVDESITGKNVCGIFADDYLGGGSYQVSLHFDRFVAIHGRQHNDCFILDGPDVACGVHCHGGTFVHGRGKFLNNLLDNLFDDFLRNLLDSLLDYLLFNLLDYFLFNLLGNLLYSFRWDSDDLFFSLFFWYVLLFLNRFLLF